MQGQFRVPMRNLIHVDALFFDCVDEVEHARVILARGTSAERQIALCQRLLEQGHSLDEAMMGVVDQLIAETAASRYSSRGAGLVRHSPSVPMISSAA